MHFIRKGKRREQRGVTKNMIRTMSQLFTDCEMSIVDKLGVVDDCARPLDFNLIFFISLIRKLWFNNLRFGDIGFVWESGNLGCPLPALTPPIPHQPFQRGDNMAEDFVDLEDCEKSLCSSSIA